MYYNKYLSSAFYILLISILDLICTLNIEELKSLNYEVDISQIPMKRGEEQTLPVIYMTSTYGQEYQCVLPQLDDEIVSEKETISEKNTDIKELLKPMKSGNCLLKGKDWWTYEFCFGHYIKQFHIEDGQIIGQVITLGLFESDYDWSNETDQEKFKHVKQRYHSQYYVNGTKCDLTGQPRNAEVRIFCEEDAGDYIYRVDEPGTCSYIITIHTSRLCSHPQLKPLPSKKAHNIPCHPLLNEDQYSVYIQKYNDPILKKGKNLNVGTEEAVQGSSTDQTSVKDKSQKLKGDKETLESLFSRLEKDGVTIESNEIKKDEASDKKDSLVDENNLSYLKTILVNNQKKKFEQAVKENLEKAGLDTSGRRIEVKIIQAGYFDNEGKDFHTLSDAETNQFQNMIMALLTGQQEAVQEMERHKKLEENYKFTWENDEED